MLLAALEHPAHPLLANCVGRTLSSLWQLQAAAVWPQFGPTATKLLTMVEVR